ncbi:MAG TPA: sigma 54-interacting transcriptional regulator, partial [Labilithrix sp.]|nr:sigma 54-interacting transcriptional regulator [Labilithrix sp.]
GGSAASGKRRQLGRFQAAEGGTLLLDEVSALPLPTQAKLLRVLDEGVVRPVGASDVVPVNVRIVSATQADLRSLVAEGKFRDDLYFRLNVLDLHIPPLRERRADMPLLLAHFLRRFCPGRVPPGIGPRAWEALMKHPFPGNVRELAHAIERAVVLARGSEIDLEHLPDDIAGRVEEPSADATIEPLHVAAKSFEKKHIEHALELAGGSIQAASKLLGISAKTLRQKMDRHGIARS